MCLTVRGRKPDERPGSRHHAVHVVAAAARGQPAAAGVLVRDAEAHRDAFATMAAYLRVEDRGVAAGGLVFAERGPELSRNFKALKAWMALKAEGTDRIAAVIEQNVAQARRFGALVSTVPDVVLAATVSLNVACWRIAPARTTPEQQDMLTREVLLRRRVLAKRHWVGFLVLCICLALSASYELIEWAVAMSSGSAADACLGGARGAADRDRRHRDGAGQCQLYRSVRQAKLLGQSDRRRRPRELTGVGVAAIERVDVLHLGLHVLELDAELDGVALQRVRHGGQGRERRT